jgi:integrase
MLPSKTTLSTYLEKWLIDYCRPNLTPKAYERYEGIVRRHLVPALGSILLTQLRPEHLQKLYSVKLKEGLRPRSVKYLHVVIHKALATAIKRGLLSRNVADGADVPKAQKGEMITWDEDDIARFLKAAETTPHYALFYTALFTGARRGELLALRWSDVDLLGAQVSVSRSLHQLKDTSFVFTAPKTKTSSRAIALSPSAIPILSGHKEKMGAILPLKADSLVFSTPEGGPLRPNTVSRAWTMLATRCGVKVIRFHDARHTHASLMLKQGIHPKIVSERLGHSGIAITLDTYSHVAPGLQEAAAASFDKLVPVKYNGVAKKEPV